MDQKVLQEMYIKIKECVYQISSCEEAEKFIYGTENLNLAINGCNKSSPITVPTEDRYIISAACMIMKGHYRDMLKKACLKILNEIESDEMKEELEEDAPSKLFLEKESHTRQRDPELSRE